MLSWREQGMGLIIVQGIVEDTRIWQWNMWRLKTKNEIDSKSSSKDSYYIIMKVTKVYGTFYRSF